MSARWLLAAVLAAGMASAWQPAHATGSRTIAVNATVVPVCKFFTAAPAINVRNTGTTGANIDPSLATTATGNVAIAYRCTNGTTPAFALPTSATLTCAACAGTPTMAATLTSTNSGAGTGLGTGRNRTLTVTGSITAAVFQNAPAGAYSGSVTVSVTP
ncbi:MAG: hypothetical protein U1F10_05190 [Burkholderiales bacterium]